MASRKPPPAPPPTPGVSPQKGISLLRRRNEIGEELIKTERLDAEVLAAWQKPTRDCLVLAFGENAKQVDDFLRAGPGSSRVFRAGDPEGEIYRRSLRYDKLRAQLASLDAAIETLLIMADIESPTEKPPTERQIDSGTSVAMFVSHSGRNRVLVEVVITLLEVAFRLPQGSIRCTSTDGYKLAGGSHVSSSLQHEVMTCKILLALLTPEALDSPYVTLEVGGRMFGKLPFIPVRACGVRARDVKAPLSEYHSLDLSSVAEVHQLIEELARFIGVRPSGAAVYQKYLDAVVSCSTSAAGGGGGRDHEPTMTFAAAPKVELSADLCMVLMLFADTEDKGTTKLRAEDVARGTGWKRSVAQHRLDELLGLGLVEASYFEGAYGFTTEGRRKAVALLQSTSRASRWTP